MEDRRRTQRQSAASRGLCHVEGESPDLWRECEVFDISDLGVAIATRYPRRSHLIGRRISVRLPAIGASIDMTLKGVVRNVSTSSDGTVRVGIEFVNLSEAELYIVDLLALGLTGLPGAAVLPGGRPLVACGGPVLTTARG
jgi:PilZ domain